MKIKYVWGCHKVDEVSKLLDYPDRTYCALDGRLCYLSKKPCDEKKYKLVEVRRKK